MDKILTPMIIIAALALAIQSCTSLIDFIYNYKNRKNQIMKEIVSFHTILLEIINKLPIANSEKIERALEVITVMKNLLLSHKININNIDSLISINKLQQKE